MAGRVYKVLYADETPAALEDNPREWFYFKTLGQLEKRVDPDNVTTLYRYNNLGQRQDTVLDLNRNGQVDETGTDRITRTQTTVLAAGDAQNPRQVDLLRTETFVWTTPGVDTHPRLSMHEVSTDQQQSWETVYRVVGTPATTHEATVLDRPNRKRTLTRAAPDGTKSVTV